MVKKGSGRELNPADAFRSVGCHGVVECSTKPHTSKRSRVGRVTCAAAARVIPRNTSTLDLCRKSQRAKEVSRNKKERQFNREALSHTCV